MISIVPSLHRKFILLDDAMMIAASLNLMVSFRKIYDYLFFVSFLRKSLAKLVSINSKVYRNSSPPDQLTPIAVSIVPPWLAPLPSFVSNPSPLLVII